MRKMTDLLRDLENRGYGALDTQETFTNIREMRENLEQEDEAWETEMTINPTDDPNIAELKEGFDHWLAYAGQAIKAGQLLNDLIAISEEHGDYLDIGVQEEGITRDDRGRYLVSITVGDIDRTLDLLDTEIAYTIANRSRRVGDITLRIKQ